MEVHNLPKVVIRVGLLYDDEKEWNSEESGKVKTYVETCFRHQMLFKSGLQSWQLAGWTGVRGNSCAKCYT